MDGRTMDLPNSKRSKANERHEIFTRNFAHVDGNFPSQVYLVGNYHRVNGIANQALSHFSQTELFADLSASSTITSISFDNESKGSKGSKGSKASALLPFVPETKPHISLSKPFVLRKHQIGWFIIAILLP